MPYYRFEGHRKTLLTWGSQLEKNDAIFEAESDEANADAVAEKGMKNWWRKENMASIDGLPALKSLPFRKETLQNFIPDLKAGAFRKKEAKVNDLDAPQDERIVWSIDPENLKFLLGVVIGFCIATLST